jgi:hypothetical protein
VQLFRLAGVDGMLLLIAVGSSRCKCNHGIVTATKRICCLLARTATSVAPYLLLLLLLVLRPTAELMSKRNIH